MGLTEILNEKFLVAVSKNKMSFLLVVLLLGNVYQYIDRNNVEAQYDDDKKKLNEQIQEINKESVQYERTRSEKLEFLLRNLDIKQQESDGSNQKTHSNR